MESATKITAMPQELERWNWGAFFLNWIWGLGNGTPIALLCLVPGANLVMPFVLGAKGNAWAWENKQWTSIEEFRRTQRNWAVAGSVVVGGMLAFVAFIFLIIMFVIVMMKSSDGFEFAERELNRSPRVVELLGTPIETGIPQGSFSESGGSGEAAFNFSVEGPKGKGRVYFSAKRDGGPWQVEQAVYEDERSGERVDFSR